MNQLNVKRQHSITTLAAKGWSARKIGRELGLHQETVGRYLGLTKPAATPAIAPAGSKAGRASQWVPFATVIQQGLAAGLSAQRVYQDLVADHGFTGAYDAVKRFVHRLAQPVELPFRRFAGREFSGLDW